MNEPQPADDRILYDAVLQPHRSLSPRGFATIMVVLAGVSFCVSLAFVLNGAWPVTPFFGVDVLLVYLAFRISYHRAKLREELRLTEDAFTVERVGLKGERMRWEFQPFWLRLIFEEKDEHTNRLVLASHGRALVVGSFLGPAERRGIAHGLQEALRHWRRRLAPSP